MSGGRYKELIALAIPSIASALLNNFYRVVDQFAVQWLGTPAQAAIGSCAFILIAFYGLFQIITAGAGPIMGRAVGAGDIEKQQEIIGNASILMAVAGLLFSCGLIFGAEFLTEIIELENESAEALITYLQTLGWWGCFIAYGPLIDSIFIASGDTKTPMYLQLASTILNAFLNFVLIYALELGIAGAALASGISRAVTTLIGLTLMIRRFGIKWPLTGLGLKLIRVGFPVATGTLMYALVYWGLLRWTISPLGPAVNAALGIGFSALEGISWPLYAGVMMAVSSLVGRQLGANKIEDAENTIRIAFPLATLLGCSCGLIFWFGAKPLCGIFTEDPAVLEQAVLYARILAFSQVFVSYEAIFEGVLGGAGHNDYQLWLSAPLNLIRIPMAYYFAFEMGYGAIGIWWAINISTFVKALSKGAIVLNGKWKKVEL